MPNPEMSFGEVLRDAILEFIVMREDSLGSTIKKCIQDYYQKPVPFAWLLKSGAIKVTLDLGEGLWDSRSTWILNIVA